MLHERWEHGCITRHEGAIHERDYQAMHLRRGGLELYMPWGTHPLPLWKTQPRQPDDPADGEQAGDWSFVMFEGLRLYSHSQFENGMLLGYIQHLYYRCRSEESKAAEWRMHAMTDVLESWAHSLLVSD